MTNLENYCTEQTHIEQVQLQVNPQVSLQLIKFIPKKDFEHTAILFIAGWVSQMSAWQEVLLELTRKYPVYYLETREKISSKVAGKVEFGVEEIALDIVQTVDLLGFKEKQYILMGSSLGATAIVSSYRNLKVKPLCLILIAPNAVFRVPTFWIVVIHLFHPLLYFIMKPIVKWYLRTFRLNVLHDKAQYEKYSAALDAADPKKLKKGILKLSKYQIWEKLPDITTPTLIVGASRDSLHEPENLKKMVNMTTHAVYLDLETNRMTHSKKMVQEMELFVQRRITG